MDDQSEEALVDKISDKGYHHFATSHLSCQVAAFLALKQRVWSANGIALLENSINEVACAAILGTLSIVNIGQKELVTIRQLIGPFVVTAACHIISSEHAICYVLKKKAPPDRHGGVVILLWSPEAQVKIYSKSHLIEHGDTGTQAAWGWIPTRQKLASTEIKLVDVPEGGV
ncbi:MAG: hypothetical protein Q9191_008030 [Dirinaria sp. TL-2023a]